MKSILCICAVALLLEAVVGLPYAGEAPDNELDLSKRMADLLSPISHQLSKRASSVCLLDCFSCFKLIRNVTPDPCISGCEGKRLTGGAPYVYDRKQWTRCASYLQRPLTR